MRFFTKLALALFGRFIPVAPYVTDFANGLIFRPENYGLFVTHDGRSMTFMHVHGDYAGLGLAVTYKRLSEGLTANLWSIYDTDIPMNIREAQILAEACQDWVEELEADEVAVVERADANFYHYPPQLVLFV